MLINNFKPNMFYPLIIYKLIIFHLYIIFFYFLFICPRNHPRTLSHASFTQSSISPISVIEVTLFIIISIVFDVIVSQMCMCPFIKTWKNENPPLLWIYRQNYWKLYRFNFQTAIIDKKSKENNRNYFI